MKNLAKPDSRAAATSRVVIRSRRRQAAGAGGLVAMFFIGAAGTGTPGTPGRAILVGAVLMSVVLLSIMVRSTIAIKDAITLRLDLVRRRTIPAADGRRVRAEGLRILVDLVDGTTVQLPGVDDGSAFAYHTERRIPGLYQLTQKTLDPSSWTRVCDTERM